MITEFTSDHASHQQKFLQLLSSGADSNLFVSKTREISPFGDPSHTLKLWRSGIYWWWLYIPDSSNKPWLVTISLLHILLEQPDKLARSAAREAGLKLKLLRNKDRMSVATIVALCAMAEWILMLAVKLVVYTVYPERSFWKTNKAGTLLCPIAVAAIPSISMVYLLDKDRAKIFGVRPHQPMDLCPVTTGGIGYTNGMTSSAKFDQPCAMTALGGTLLVVDRGNSVVRLVDLNTSIPASSGLFTVETDRTRKKSKTSGTQSLAACATSSQDEVPRNRKKSSQVCTITDSDGCELKFEGASAICAAADGSAAIYLTTDTCVYQLKNIHARDGGGTLNCTAETIQIGEKMPQCFWPLQGICDCGNGFLVVSARGVLLRISLETTDYRVLTKDVGQPRGLAMWNNTHLLVADSSRSQIIRIALPHIVANSAPICEQWVGQERDPSGSEASTDGTSVNATLLWPCDLEVFGMSVFVVEYGKLRIVSSLEPLGRALREMQALVDLARLSGKQKTHNYTFKEGAAVFQSMKTFQDECSKVGSSGGR
jgi:hypothetical protein